MADLREQGVPGVQTSMAAAAPSLSHGVVAIECGIGEMASLIAHSDEYLGYDSACQHIAAAVRTPTLTIFAGSNNKNFIRRWSACGDTDCRIVHVNTLTDSQHIDVNELVARIMQERAQRTPEPPKPMVQEIRASRPATNTSSQGISKP